MHSTQSAETAFVKSAETAGMSLKYVRVLCLVAVAVAAVGATDLLLLFERIHDEGTLTTYQCYRTGVNLEPPSSHNLVVKWGSVAENPEEAENECTFVTNGTGEEQRIEVSAKYYEVGDYGTLSGPGALVTFTQLKPAYQGEAYYFREVDSDGRAVFKIYDTNEDCTNAAALRDEICPDHPGCDELEYVR